MSPRPPAIRRAWLAYKPPARPVEADDVARIDTRLKVLYRGMWRLVETAKDIGPYINVFGERVPVRILEKEQ